MTDTVRRAILTVADHAHNADDCRQLLDMLGLLNTTPPRPKPERKPGRPRVDHGHGHPATYRNGCRCTECRDAHRKAAQALRDKRRQDSSSADRAGHGKATTYRNHGCRCTECRDANRLYFQGYRERRRERELAGTGAATC